MSGYLESDAEELEYRPRLLSLAEAAQRLGCHVETLRIRIRDGRLDAYRGPHGRYYIEEDDLPDCEPLRRRRQPPADPAAVERMVAGRIESLLLGIYRPMAWQRSLIEPLRQDRAADIHLYRSIAVECLVGGGWTVAAAGGALGISERHARRLAGETLLGAFQRALARRRRAERGRIRRSARATVEDIRARLAANGFRPARRDRRRSESGARDGLPARIAVLRELRQDHRRSLRAAGFSDEQIDAIAIVGIGYDEFNELVLKGLPPSVQQR